MILVFVGAGGSAAVNPEQYPTTVEFFERLPDDITQEPLFVLIREFLRHRKGRVSIDIEAILWNLNEIGDYFKASCDTDVISGWIMANQRFPPLIGMGDFPQLPNLLTGMRELQEDGLRVLKDEINALVYEFYGHHPDDGELADWINLLRGLKKRDSEIEIFTTNYDVLLEFAVNQAQIDVETGRRSDGIQMRLDTTIWDNPGGPIEKKCGRLTKLHGSVDWQNQNGNIVAGNHFFTGDHENHLILYPGYKGEPDIGLFRKFHDHLRAVAEKADVAIFIGFAFRDEYINTILSTLPPEKPKIIINKDSAVPEVSFLAGCTHFQDGFTSESVESCLQSLSPQFHFNRGNEEYGQGNHQAAVVAYDKAIQHDPEYSDAYYNRGNAKLALENKPGAIADYDRALAHNQQFAEAYYNRGLVKSGQGDSEGAREDYMKATGLGLNLSGATPAPMRAIGTVEANAELHGGPNGGS